MPSHLCPKCGSTKITTNAKGGYECTNCNHKWIKASEDRARRVQTNRKKWEEKKNHLNRIEIQARHKKLRKNFLFGLQKYLYFIIPPLALWLAFGHKILNYLLVHDLSDGMFQFLGYGGGLTIFVLMWTPFWRGWFRDVDEEDLQGDLGCFGNLILVVVSIVASYFIIKPDIRDANIIDLIFPPRMAAQVKMADVIAACDRLSIPEAAEYSTKPGIHPVVVVNGAGGWHKLSNTIPKTWQAQSLSELELVACVYPVQTTVIQKCEYSRGGTAKRIQYSMEVDLFDAKTGARLKHLIIEGMSPDSCPDYTSQSVRTVLGGDPDLIQALTPYVEK